MTPNLNIRHLLLPELSISKHCFFKHIFEFAHQSIHLNSTVSAVGFCDAEVDINTPHGVYNWSETEVGKNATNKCVYNTTEQFGLARRHCASARQWDNYYGHQCITETTYRIQMLVEVSVTVVRMW